MSTLFTMFNHIKSTRFYLPSPINHHVHKSWTEMALILTANDISRWDVLPSCVDRRTEEDPSALGQQLGDEFVSLFRGQIVIEDLLGVFGRYGENSVLKGSLATFK
jgi:hypothetical protein